MFFTFFSLLPPCRSPLIFDNEMGATTAGGITNVASSTGTDGGESVRRGKVVVKTTTTAGVLTTPGTESAPSNQSSDVEELQQVDQGKM